MQHFFLFFRFASGTILCIILLVSFYRNSVARGQFKVQLIVSLVFVSNYLSCNIKHICENVIDFGQIFLFPYYYNEIRKVSSILVHWPRPEEDWR